MRKNTCQLLAIYKWPFWPIKESTILCRKFLDRSKQVRNKIVSLKKHPRSLERAQVKISNQLALFLTLRMNISVNSSMMNETDASIFMDRGTGYVAYKLIVFLLILIPIAVADILIIIATILEPSIKRTVKVALINIPIACLIVMAGFTIDAIAASAFTLARMAVPDLWPCYLQAYLIALGAVSRLVFMFVRVGKKATPFIFATVVTSLWVFLVLFNCVLFIPGVMIIEWTDGVSCIPDSQGQVSSNKK